MVGLRITCVDPLASTPIPIGDTFPIKARIGIGQFHSIAPGQRLAIRTGMSFRVPYGHVLRLDTPVELAELGIVGTRPSILPGETKELVLTLIHLDQFGPPAEIRHGQTLAHAYLLQTASLEITS